MDLGNLSGLDGLGECSDSGFATLASSDPETRSKLYGSGVILKQEDDLRSIKMAKTSDDDFSASKGMMLLQQRSNGLVLRSDVQSQQQMLCFSSSPKSETMFMERSSQSAAAFPYFHHSSSSTPAYGGNTGYSCGSINGATSILSGLRGPFTPSQWMELEHQALIYKYITANMPIPSNLLNPIKRALDSVSFSPFTGHSLRPTSLGWGSFHVGFSNSTDPEPGRCRRTDGKKWRCSRDAVADAKYCERHMNRGRHRSRKPVEGQTGQSAARNAAATPAAGPMPVVSSSAPAVVVSGAGGGASNSLANVQPEVKNLHPGRASNPSVATHLNGCRVYLNKENVGDRMEDSAGLSMLSPTMNLKPKETPFSISKESSRTDFGLVSSDSLLNPSHKNPSFMGFQNFTSHDPSNREPESQHSLRPFIDNWPKNQSDRSSIFWPEVGSQLDQTQLSISIPSNNKVTLSPLKLSCEIDPIQMGLGVGNGNETVKKQANWIPTQWGTSVGGPLGEVLHSTNNSSGGECKDTSALSLGTDGWEGSSPCLGSSPTGVLQKTTFGSLSNSSAGSSPRPEISKTHEAFFTASALTGDL